LRGFRDGGKALRKRGFSRPKPAFGEIMAWKSFFQAKAAFLARKGRKSHPPVLIPL
jgi:hypothetical protein